MARLQILELPEGAGDERPPFILVIDQAPRDERSAAFRDDLVNNEIAERIGARSVLVFEDTIDIPADDTSAYAASLHEAQRTDADTAQARVTEGMRLAHERVDIARDMDRLAKWKNELLDALGMDRTRDWDDIRNAAAGLRRDRDDKTEAIERIRRLHQPVDHRGKTICWECSDYDFPGQTTDSPPVPYDQCGTLRALNGQQDEPRG